MRHKKLLIPILVAVLALAVTPAVAGEWYLYLEAASIEPSNAALIGANVVDEDDSGAFDIQTNTLLEAEPGSELAGRIGVGFSAGDGVIGLSYWGYSGDDRVSASLFDSVDGFVYIDDSMEGDNFEPETGSASVLGEIDASTIDLAYYMSHSNGSKISTHYNFGITAVEYEEKIVLAADGDFFGTPGTRDETYMLDVSGFGFSVGGGVQYALGDSAALYGRAGVRFMMSDTDEKLDAVSAFDDVIEEQDIILDSRDGSGIIWDFAAGAKLYKSETVSIGLEYQLSSWNNLVQRQTLGSEDDDAYRFPARDNVAFHGIALTALFRFGSD